MKRMERYVDPRTKLFLLLAMNIVLLNTGTGVFLSWLKFVIGFLPFVLLLTAGRWKMAWGYLCVYLGSYAILSGVLAHTGGAVMMLFGFLASMGTKFLPGGMLGVYFYAVPE